MRGLLRFTGVIGTTRRCCQTGKAPTKLVGFTPVKAPFSTMQSMPAAAPVDSPIIACLFPPGTARRRLSSRSGPGPGESTPSPA